MARRDTGLGEDDMGEVRTWTPFVEPLRRKVCPQRAGSRAKEGVA